MTIQSRVEDAVPDAATTTSALAKPVMAVALMALGLTTAALVSLRAGDDIALLLALGSIGVAAVYVGLRNPVWSLMFLLVTMFLRIPLTDRLPIDPFLIAFAGLVISAGIWLAGNPEGRPKLGATEVMMTLFIAWNVNSILWPHDLPALANSAFEEQLPLARYFIISTVIPFVVYYISRAIFTNLKAIRILLIILLIIGAYSAVVSICSSPARTPSYGPSTSSTPPYFRRAGQRSGQSTQRQRTLTHHRICGGGHPRDGDRPSALANSLVGHRRCVRVRRLPHPHPSGLSGIRAGGHHGRSARGGYRRAFVTTGRRSNHRNNPRLVHLHQRRS